MILALLTPCQGSGRWTVARKSHCAAQVNYRGVGGSIVVVVVVVRGQRPFPPKQFTNYYSQLGPVMVPRLVILTSYWLMTFVGLRMTRQGCLGRPVVFEPVTHIIVR